MPEAQPRRTTAKGSESARLKAGGVDELVARLGSEWWADRRAAEDGLQKLGTAVVPALINCLLTGPDQVRWGAAKVLGEIADPSATLALVEALDDTNGGVRWIAAQALIAAGPGALVPLLRRLITRADSPWLQEGAHHVLRGLATPTVSPVIRALEDRFPALTVPVAANEALKALASEQSS